MSDWDEKDLSEIERRIFRSLRRRPETPDDSIFGDMDQLMRDILYGGGKPEEGSTEQGRAVGNPTSIEESPDLGPREIEDPLIEVTEERDVVRIIAEAPGVAEEDVTLKTHDGQVEIRCGDRWRRSVKVPMGLSMSKANKKLRNGVLEIVIPRGRSVGGGV